MAVIVVIVVIDSDDDDDDDDDDDTMQVPIAKQRALNACWIPEYCRWALSSSPMTGAGQQCETQQDEKAGGGLYIKSSSSSSSSSPSSLNLST